jgi:indolepyruvate ferredoxin oxidoreductase beta subunit
VANAAERYPHHALDFLQQKGLRVMALPASQCARDLGDGRMANVIMLGALSALLALPDDVWKETLQERVPARYRESNLRAFEIGKELASPAPNPLPLATELPVGRGRGQGGE